MMRLMHTGAKSVVIKFILFGILLLAMAGLAIMDVSGMVSGGVGGKTVVARMDGEKITTTEFDRLFQQELRSQNLTIEQAYRAGFPQMVLQQEINRRVMSRATRDLGLLVDDKTAAVEIKKLIQPLVQQQGMTEDQALQHVLRTVGIGERQLVATVKDQIARENLLKAITGGTNVPEQMVNDALKYRYEHRRGEFITLSPSDVGAVKEPTEEELKNLYSQLYAAYMMPEKRSFAVILLDYKALGIKTPTEAEIKAYYDANQKEFMQGDTRDIAQVVTKDAALAEKIRADVAAGKGIKEAAGKTTVVRGTYAEADLPEEIAEAAFAAKAGEVALVESPLGFHVVYVEKINAPAAKPFASVKQIVAEKLSADSALYEKANEIDDMVAGGKPLADVAAQFGLRETVFTDVETGKKPATDIPMFDKVLQSVFALDKGEASQLIETPKGFLLAEVRDISPAAPKPFAEVRAEIVKTWKQARQAEAYQEKAAKIIERINLGEAFDKVADTLGKRVERTDMVGRGAPGAGLTPAASQALFAIDKVGQAMPVQEENGGLKILRLVERKVEMPQKPDPKDVQTLRYILGQALQNDILEQYRRALMAKYDVEINAALIERMYAPKAGGDIND